MNYYERIQRSIDYIEEQLTGPIRLEQAASEACFSTSHFYRIFHALVGHSVKEYIRKRRLSEAAARLISHEGRIIDLSFDYQFESQEAFTRAFKKLFGMTPGEYRRAGNLENVLPRLDVIAEYFLTDRDVGLSDPRIKVLKELQPMRVASYRAFGRNPEREALSCVCDWAERQGLIDEPYRLFGFDNPGPQRGVTEYGYEAWLTVGSDVQPNDEINIKEFPGGLYAVTPTTVTDIQEAWKHFMVWLAISRYSHGCHQCLEEHLSPAGTVDETTQIDLYLPLSIK